jgi:prolyl-tRNA editing enzyme YbaK/EbsC (Cys-tRNA(Pro) deacylase)
MLLVVASGTARLDNRKVKDVLGGKPRMLDAEQVLAATSHPVGGVCPFGLPSPLPIYCDVSLQRFAEVVPAAGSTNAAVKIATERLAELTGAVWVDVCR